MSDFERALAVIGTVGVIAAIARNSQYSYYRYHHYPPRPVVVIQPSPTVIVGQTPVIVETPVVVEREVIVEKPVYIETPAAAVDNFQQPVENFNPAVPHDPTVQYIDPPVEADHEMLPIQLDINEAFSPKLGGIFRMEFIQIPDYCFMAAQLTSDPLEGSPLHALGLQEGDVITRLGGTPVNEFDVLEQHEQEVEVRYIKAGTERVLLANVYIPTDAELWGDEEPYLAP